MEAQAEDLRLAWEHDQAMIRGLRQQVTTLTKLLWREYARHRRAGRDRAAKDLEVTLHRLMGER